VVIATIMTSNKPNAVTVMFVKVVSDNEILITDNFMNQTLKDIKQNNNVVVSVWNKEFKGYKLIGKAKYYNKGQWLDKVKSMKENKGLPAKGAILIKISKIIPAC
jgi:predicted pyridoxine 5'-phosphate oxidase superfamily flavin-nucleotide-binding protein